MTEEEKGAVDYQGSRKDQSEEDGKRQRKKGKADYPPVASVRSDQLTAKAVTKIISKKAERKE